MVSAVFLIMDNLPTTILFGDDFTATAPDCDLPAGTAAKLRQAARDIVMGDRNSFKIR